MTNQSQRNPVLVIATSVLLVLSLALSPARATVSAVPEGTTLVVRVIDPVDSRTNTVGETFRASLDEPVMVSGETAIPRGADVMLKLVKLQSAGKITGRSELTLDIVSVAANGKTIDIATDEVTSTGKSRTRESTAVIGGGAALGAVLGGLAGGGKGAAIGAIAGGGAGSAYQIFTKGSRLRIPAETRLKFTLQQPIHL